MCGNGTSLSSTESHLEHEDNVNRVTLRYLHKSNQKLQIPLPNYDVSSFLIVQNPIALKNSKGAITKHGAMVNEGKQISIKTSHEM